MKNNKLLSEIKRAGITVADLCSSIGMARSSFYRKTNGYNSFDTKEIIDICNVLHITDGRKIKSIFLD